MAFRRLLFILFLFLSGTYANTLHEIDENKLKEFIKKIPLATIEVLSL